MKELLIRPWLKHFLIVLGFAITALAFYYPLLSGKKMLQSDIRQYDGMSRQLKEYRKAEGTELYWIDNAYGGMPTYQLGVQYPADFLSFFYQGIRLLPRPAHLLFLYLVAAYVLLLILRMPWHTALFGAFAYGFSTYLLIILQVGHNTKAEALGYMPLIFGGAFLWFQNKRFWGFLLTTLALGLQVRANHYQMTYYTLLLLSVLVLFYAYEAYRTKACASFFKAFLGICASGILALGLNATPLLATSEYAAFSTRGKTELKQNPDGSPMEQSSGLNYDYITEYSYGIFESIGLMAPRVQGGGSREDLGTKSEIYRFLLQEGVAPAQARQFAANVPTYWGNQPILEAPAYVGITVVFFALLALFFMRGSVLKYWLIVGTVLSLLLSWGKNVPWLTNFLIDYFPLYNKFRAVSSAQVLLELCLPILGSFGVYHLFKANRTDVKKLLQSTSILVGFFLLLLLSKGMLSFSGVSDGFIREAYGAVLYEKIVAARKTIFNQDIFRVLLFCVILGAIAWGFLMGKIKKPLALTAVIAILLVDLLSVSNRYIDKELFVNKRLHNQPFQMTSADQVILQDSNRFRVFEPQLGLTGGRTAFFHNAIGGYHGAKPRRYQELYDFYTTHEIRSVLDMLNVKYLLYEEAEGLQALENPKALGNVWLVDSLQIVENADAALEAFKNFNPESEAIVEWEDISDLEIDNTFVTRFKQDSLAGIVLTKVAGDRLEYQFTAAEDQFAVFSEMYYPKGWSMTIDGLPSKILRVNYVLRAAFVPKGTHTVVFSFTPSFLKTGTVVRWGSLGIFIALLAGVFFKDRKELKRKS